MDTVYQADKAWLLNIQRKLYTWSRTNPDDAWRDMWNWVTQPQNLRLAWRRVASNRGARSSGVDKVTVKHIETRIGVARFLTKTRTMLLDGSYRPQPVRRVLIPKRGKPGLFRPLGVPTVRDRVVQAALLQLLEPIFEAEFITVSYGFRPKRACRDALEHIRNAIRPVGEKTETDWPRPPYQWVIEGDIKGCFDNIDHHHVMTCLRRRVADRRVTRLVRAFLKAGALSEGALVRTKAGTPQGGVLSPLLANIMLTGIEGRYAKYVSPRLTRDGKPYARPGDAIRKFRHYERKAGRPVFLPIRYADDFVVLVNGTEEQARAEKEELAVFLRNEMKLTLSPEKTHITSLTEGFEFLGHRVRLRWDDRWGYWPRIEIPTARVKDFRHRIKQYTTRGRWGNRRGQPRQRRPAPTFAARQEAGGGDAVTASSKAIRCAIYTRVSTDSGLDQEFNSLDAQYDAASAYIRSQAHAHWTQVRTRYDDGGFSGGSTDRPGLQRLLADVKARKVQVIVVYKVDRLTRSLADFAKLVELFDAHGVSFVSVTQQFNTTTSMGRLTLNVLLSFAQFEREVTAERIRDKVAASKRKGLWVGGMVPLGYQLNDGKLSIVEDEAERVRMIFRRYLALGSVNRLVLELRQRNVRTKVRKLSNGSIRGGVHFTQGPLFYMLRNRFYIGEVLYKGEICPGPQPPLLDREQFEAVQRRLTEQRSHQVTARTRNDAPFRGLLFDAAGHPMVPTHATKQGVRYRYYVSQPYLRGLSKPPPGAIIRVPASDLEAAVTKALTEHQGRANGIAAAQTDSAHLESLRAQVTRVEVRANQLAVWLRLPVLAGSDETAEQMVHHDPALLIPWSKPSSKRFKEILLPACNARAQVRPIKIERRAALLKSIARGRAWLNEIVSGTSRIEDIAVRQRCSVRHVNMTVSMAFIAPDLVKAAIQGRLPRGIGVAALRDAPAEWSLQFERLGLAKP